MYARSEIINQETLSTSLKYARQYLACSYWPINESLYANSSPGQTLRQYHKSRYWNVQGQPYQNTLMYFVQSRIRRGVMQYASMNDRLTCNDGEYYTPAGKYQGHDRRQSMRVHEAVRGNPGPSKHNTLEFEAKDRLLKRIKEQKALMLVTMAESKKTASMIGDTARTLARAFSALRRGNLRKVGQVLGIARPKEVPGSLSNQWLAYRYGWTPLYMEVVGMAEQCAKTFELERPPLFTIRSFSEAEVLNTYESTRSGTNEWYWSFPSSKTRVSVLLQERYGTWATVTADKPALKTLSEFGVTDFATTAFELLPLSFVANWFVPVGSFISSLTALQGVRVLDAGTSFCSEVTTDESITEGWGHSTAQVFAKDMTYSRSKIIDTADLRPDYARITLSDNWRHMVDGIALLRQTLSPQSSSEALTSRERFALASAKHSVRRR